MIVRRFRNRFVRRIEKLLKKHSQPSDRQLLEIEISMTSEDGKDWWPAAYCDAYRTGDYNINDGLLSKPDVDIIRCRYPAEGYWDEQDTGIWSYFEEPERRRLFLWLDQMYTRHLVLSIDHCFVNFMRRYIDTHVQGEK